MNENYIKKHENLVNEYYESVTGGNDLLLNAILEENKFESLGQTIKKLNDIIMQPKVKAIIKAIDDMDLEPGDMGPDVEKLFTAIVNLYKLNNVKY